MRRREYGTVNTICKKYRIHFALLECIKLDGVIVDKSEDGDDDNMDDDLDDDPDASLADNGEKEENASISQLIHVNFRLAVASNLPSWR